MSKGADTFRKIFGDQSDTYLAKLKKRSPALSDKAMYYPYQNFYSNEADLALSTRLLVTIASLVSQGELTDLPMYIMGALNVGCHVVEVSETILQMGIYVGEPKAHRAMDVFSQVLAEQKMDLEEHYKEKSQDGEALESGDTIFKQLFGEEKASTVYGFLKTLSPSLSGFAIEHPFGEFYAKKHLLNLKVRELITVASLVSTGMLPQLKLHIGAALYVGCTLSEVEQVILQMSAYAGNPAMLNAMKEFAAVKPEISDHSSGPGLKK